MPDFTRRQFCKSVALGLGSAAGGCNSIHILSTRGDTLATDWESRRRKYDFVIVGSGYGGSIAAARLSAIRTGQAPSVCLLERGEEWPVGRFPDTQESMIRSIRTPTGNPLGLYEFRISPDVSVVQGCGLGGTSLINGNVALPPPPEAFGDARWPTGLSLGALQPYLARAAAMLGVSPHPKGDQFLRTAALRRRAEPQNLPVQNLPLTINFELDGLNEFGVARSPCTDCGDCVTGCNVGAKNTLPMNYLPAAKLAGAHIFTRTEVESVRRAADGSWEVHGRRHGFAGRAESFVLQADHVILAAGVMGTVEILLRSRAEGLALSPRLGLGFSGNGDFLGIAHNGDAATNALGFGSDARHPWRRHAPGPTIIGGIQHGGSDRARQFLVQDTCIPSALIKGAMFLFASLPGEDLDRGDEAAELLRYLADDRSNPYREHNTLNHSIVFLVMANDGADGLIELGADGRAAIRWNAREREIFQLINDELREHSRALGARFIPHPTWKFLEPGSLVSVHPLGGCGLADDHERGVADEFGRVFRGDGEVHRGLYVADGSIVPTSLGVNPLLTISALCERIAEQIARDYVS